MPNWHEINDELRTMGSSHDGLRRRHIKNLFDHTGRNVIAYYSGWLQKPEVGGVEVNDEDKNGFMTVIHKLDRAKGLDLLLHTPGGDTAATESLVDYLRAMFKTDIRAIIPQLAMSAGTMISCACKEIIMGKQSSLGPIDPQFGGLPAHGILEEFQQAFKEIQADNLKAAVWQPILGKYSPALIGECQKVLKWSNTMVAEWLGTGMLKDDPDRDTKIDKIMKELGDHSLNLTHARHLPATKCKEIGLKIVDLEADQTLQDKVLSVHHSFMHTLTATSAHKIIENHEGVAFIKLSKTMIIPG